MRIIALAGNMNTGKDTAANHLVEAGFVVVAFADRIKQLAHKIFEFDEPTLFGPSALRNRIDPRGGDVAYWLAVHYRTGLYAGELTDLFAPANLPDPTAAVAAFRVLLAKLMAEPQHFSARHVLQQMGTEWGRVLWPDVWIHALRVIVKKVEKGFGYSRLGGLVFADNPTPPGVVITDCRFPANEGAAVRSWGGEVYWLDAVERVPPASAVQHASEPTYQDFQPVIAGVIDNNGSLAQLKATMQLVLASQ
jgi:hypothetical protein